MPKVKVCVLRTAGTNCDKETAFAFRKAGSEPESLHINSFLRAEKKLGDFQVLAIPGGFSYGDDLGAGKILANELRCRLAEDIRRFIKDGKLVIGICNGFQVLVKAGILPGTRPYRIGRRVPLHRNSELKQEASLIINDSGKFEARWVYLKNPQNKCVWTKGLPEVIYLPVAHGEGKFVTGEKKALARLKRNKQIVFQYCDEQGTLAGYPHNPNGSIENIAGICDETGRILGLMPHPERHIYSQQHPRWAGGIGAASGDGLTIIRNGVEYAQKTLL